MFKKRRRGEIGGATKSDQNLRKLNEVVLRNAKLRFCPEQLHNLNYIFDKRLQNNLQTVKEKNATLAKSVTERLVQRLVCGVGMLDPRFSSKYLITNNHTNTAADNLNLKYIIRLDKLSTPCLYKSDVEPKYTIFENDPDYPAGYARIRLHTSMLKIWQEYANPGGYLRRDKIQARFIELLAAAAAMETPVSPLNIDESVNCGSPGKIINPATLDYILKIPSEQHVYYGPSESAPRFPDPRDFRLAIIDEPSGVRLKIEFLSPALASVRINVQLLIGINLDAWPATTDFPGRVSMGHSDCLLHQSAAQTSAYLIGFGVQSSAWQIRLPGAEYILINHYAANSSIKIILDLLNDCLNRINAARNLKTNQISYQILNKYILLTILLEELELNSSTPLNDLINFAPMYLSTNILNILDKLIFKLQSENQPNYFFKKSNLLINPGHLSDDDYTTEAANIKRHLIQLFDESLMSTKSNTEFNKMLVGQESEILLLVKWKHLVEGLLPPKATRGRRFCFAGSKNQVADAQYTEKQLEYIALLIKSHLNVKQRILHSDVSDFEHSFQSEPEVSFTEDIIYILLTILNQARDEFINANQTNKNKSKIKSNYNNCMAKLIELVRKDKELSKINIQDDALLVKIILKWLYRAVDQNKRHLAPILRPYLQKLFVASHAISWQLDAIKKQLINEDELKALGAFAQLINEQQITPAIGILDAYNKNWTWAQNMLLQLEKAPLRLVFVGERHVSVRHIVTLPDSAANVKKVHNKVQRQKTLPSATSCNYFNSLLRNKDDLAKIPKHDELKLASPLTSILQAKHRRGVHRGYGDILNALNAMQKLNIFQEVTKVLPQAERVELAELLHGLQTRKQRRLAEKKWSTTLPHLQTGNKVSPVQKYTPKEESAGIRIVNVNDGFRGVDGGSLIGTCRAVRVKEDLSSGTVFLRGDFAGRVKKSESFKY